MGNYGACTYSNPKRWRAGKKRERQPLCVRGCFISMAGQSCASNSIVVLLHTTYILPSGSASARRRLPSSSRPRDKETNQIREGTFIDDCGSIIVRCSRGLKLFPVKSELLHCFSGLGILYCTDVNIF